jgi:dihydrofolate reductase
VALHGEVDPFSERVTYSMSLSLDGYIVGPDRGFDWTAPDEEVFRFWIDEIRQVGVHLLGRRLYETMLHWETADHDTQPSRLVSSRPARPFCERSQV